MLYHLRPFGLQTIVQQPENGNCSNETITELPDDGKQLTSETVGEVVEERKLSKETPSKETPPEIREKTIRVNSKSFHDEFINSNRIDDFDDQS